MKLAAPLAVDISAARMPAPKRQDDLTRSDRRRDREMEEPERWDGMA